MTPREIAWRTRSALRDIDDRVRLAARRFPAERRLEVPAAPADIAPIVLCDAPVGVWANAVPGTPEGEWVDALRRRADAIARHQLTFFSLVDHHLGDPIDWNRDHETGRSAPTGFSGSIDYRDVAVAGDAKVVWEPNRHHHLVVLGRAYRATGELRYAAAAVEQLTSWLDQCPFGHGMNWRSPLEVAIRAINWVWTYDLLRPSGLLDGAAGRRFCRALDLHVWEVSRKYSQGSSANNHLIGEAAGVFVATTYFPWLPHAATLALRSRDILEEQVLAQTYADGGSREQAFGYHLFVTQFFLVAAAIARKASRGFSAAYSSRLERMVEFVAAMAEAGPLPALGDADDGYVVDLDDRPTGPAAVLAPAAALFGRSEFRRPDDTQQSAFWIAGRRPEEGPPRRRAPLAARAFRETGYYLLQCGEPGSTDAVSVLFDCADLGFGPLAAHGHADALSITVRAFGGDLIVDPGTYDYFSFPAWRDHFRGTAMHNTLVIDGEDQSVRLGPFMWGDRATATCVEWTVSPTKIRVAGEHDGYTRLRDPVRHRRIVELDTLGREVTIVDEIATNGRHRVSLHLHLAERCSVEDPLGQEVRIHAGSFVARLHVDPRLRTTIVRADERSMGGWVSRGYHRKSAAPTLKAEALITGNTTLVTRLSL
jgi:hypothetical protein